jgi:hypothetical protein
MSRISRSVCLASHSSPAMGVIFLIATFTLLVASVAAL